MQTGRQMLARIEGAVAELHNQETRVDEALKSAVADAERLRVERTEALKELARVKLDEITAGRLVRDLDAAERRALDILEDRKHRLATATERRAQAIREVEEAEAQRHQTGGAVEAALEAVETLRAEAEARVRETPDWRAAKERFDAADAIAIGAEKKKATSDSELSSKKRPYDADPLFTYLWSRGFGTNTYKAGNLVRMVDRMVADYIGFTGARANYAMLIEIPARLGDHAKGKRAAADVEKAALADIERQAMLAAGLDAKERALTEARHKLAAAEATLEGKRTQLKAIEEARSALLLEGRIPGYDEALGTIAAGDAKDSIAQLYREARRTQTAEDEQLVRRIELIDQRSEAVEKEVQDLRKSARDLAERRSEVERTRDRFRSAGYDHPHSTFGNDSDIGRVLAQVLEGVIRSGILWDLLREGFRTRAPRGRPDFGSPSFPFPFPMPGGGDSGPAGGGWREPGTRGGWFPEGGGSWGGGGSGSSSSDSSGGGRRDDFTTGGSF